MEIMISWICSTDKIGREYKVLPRKPLAKQRSWIEQIWEVEVSSLRMYTMADFGV
jgi:hypothetical protein